MKSALVFGANGFVGSFLLRNLLDNPGYERVTAVVRKDMGISHPKLKVLIGDLRSLPDLRDGLAADDVFIALGATKKKTPDRAEYYRVDHDYPVLAASLAKDQGASSVFLVSSVGADVESAAFYLKTKGEAERDIAALDFAHTHIFRPSVIMGERPEHRPMEKTLGFLFSLINPLLVWRFRRYRSMEAEDIARAMVSAGSRPAGKCAIYEWEQIHALL